MPLSSAKLGAHGGKMTQGGYRLALQECGNGHLYDTDIYPRCPYCQQNTPFGSNRGAGLNYGATVAPQGYAAPAMMNYGATVAPQGYGADNAEQPDAGAPLMDYGATIAPQSYTADEAEQPKTEAPAPFEEEQFKTESPAPFEEEQFKTESPAPFEEALLTTEAPAPKTAAPTPQTELPLVGWLVCLEGEDCGTDYRVFQKFNTVGKSERADIRLKDHADNRFAIWARIDYSETDNVCRLNPISTGNVLLNGVAIEEPTELVDRDRLSLGGCEYLFVPLCCGSFRWNNSSQEA